MFTTKEAEEMFSIYRSLKLQIVNQTDAVQKDKLQFSEKMAILMNENEDLQTKIGIQILRYNNAIGAIKKLQKENEKLKQEIKELQILSQPKTLTKEDMNRKLDQFNNIE